MAGSSRTSPKTVSEAELARAARETLAEAPDALAVLLFGSRAGGTATPHSDWDVAVITQKTDRPESLTPLDRLPGFVVPVAMPLSRLREKRNAAGHLAVSLLRDGRLLTGVLPEVGKLNRRPEMEPADFAQWAENIRRRFDSLGNDAGALAERKDAVSARDLGVTLAESTARISELFAKLVLDRRLGHYPFSHDLNDLGATLEAEDSDGRWRDKVALIRQLDGDTRHHHQAMYINRTIAASDIECGAQRIVLLADALVEEHRDAVATPVLKDAATTALAEIAGRGKWRRDRLPEEGMALHGVAGPVAEAAARALPAVRDAFARFAAAA